MKKLRIILDEVLNEYHTYADGELNYEIIERINTFKYSVLSDFLYDNDETYTKNMPWRLISYPRLKRIWEQWANFGFVRDEKGLIRIENIMISNTIKMDALTTLAGHTSEPIDDYYEDAWGGYIEEFIQQFYEDYASENRTSNDPNQLEFDWESKNGDGKPKEEVPVRDRIINTFLSDKLKDLNPMRVDKMSLKASLIKILQGQFLEYYITDPKIGHMRISDYGLKPLQELAGQLLNTHNSSSKVVVIDRMLNVVHQRSDMASWFVQGGSNALADLSASPSERADNANNEE